MLWNRFTPSDLNYWEGRSLVQLIEDPSRTSNHTLQRAGNDMVRDAAIYIAASTPHLMHGGVTDLCNGA